VNRRKTPNIIISYQEEDVDVFDGTGQDALHEAPQRAEMEQAKVVFL
jgi:hypothetical protein